MNSASRLMAFGCSSCLLRASLCACACVRAYVRACVRSSPLLVVCRTTWAMRHQCTSYREWWDYASLVPCRCVPFHFVLFRVTITLCCFCCFASIADTAYGASLHEFCHFSIVESGPPKWLFTPKRRGTKWYKVLHVFGTHSAMGVPWIVPRVCHNH